MSPRTNMIMIMLMMTTAVMVVGLPYGGPGCAFFTFGGSAKPALWGLGGGCKLVHCLGCKFVLTDGRVAWAVDWRVAAQGRGCKAVQSSGCKFVLTDRASGLGCRQPGGFIPNPG